MSVCCHRPSVTPRGMCSLTALMTPSSVSSVQQTCPTPISCQCYRSESSVTTHPLCRLFVVLLLCWHSKHAISFVGTLSVLNIRFRGLATVEAASASSLGRLCSCQGFGENRPPKSVGTPLGSP